MYPVLNTTRFTTPLGEILAVADDEALHLLEFCDYKNIDLFMQRLQQKTQASFIQANTPILKRLKKELDQYFSGKLKQFTIPLHLHGTEFQCRVWQALQNIPYGKTISYKDLAIIIGEPRAYRAVANANGANLLAVIIPCHRVISNDGHLGGYGGGLDRKAYLLNLERGKAALDTMKDNVNQAIKGLQMTPG